MRILKTLLAGGLFVAAVACASAGTVTLNGSASSTLDANVSEQATISVPATYAFAVTDITQDTPVTGTQAVSLTNIVLDDSKSVEIWVTAGSANFSAATGGTVVYAASDVSWGAPTDSGLTGAAGALSNGTAVSVGTSSSTNPSSITATVPFVLDKHSTDIDRAGTEALTVTWTVTSV